MIKQRAFDGIAEEFSRLNQLTSKNALSEFDISIQPARHWIVFKARMIKLATLRASLKVEFIQVPRGLFEGKNVLLLRNRVWVFSANIEYCVCVRTEAPVDANMCYDY